MVSQAQKQVSGQLVSGGKEAKVPTVPEPRAGEHHPGSRAVGMCPARGPARVVSAKTDSAPWALPTLVALLVTGPGLPAPSSCSRCRQRWRTCS